MGPKGEEVFKSRDVIFQVNQIYEDLNKPKRSNNYRFCLKSYIYCRRKCKGA